MKIWVISFILLFGFAEFFQWASHVTLPLPVFILAGALLAIASNADKRSGLPFRAQPTSPAPNLPAEPATPLPPPAPPRRSISFLIRNPEETD
ncbi:hypothetical protein BST81_07355 [Leptolyngbya sp. 'hensonii']|uniref:hypothetical protein n=1 Tax=Leptolyngbya sp. 'hensonii' TaxID=1922337 RepID=UPI0009501681|nr:hypothetical protein [Leptolyngbya sp. 'hensonii']OLP19030.1 hypothetical protein BST81_07355 [Leptolyngbya sp. 'hensonii']